MGAALAGRVLGGPLARAWQHRVTQDQGTQDQVTQDQGTQDQVTQDQGTQDQVTQDQVTQDQGTQDQGTRDQVTLRPGSREAASVRRAWPLLAAWAAVVLAVSVPPLVTARPAAPDNAALATWLEDNGLHSGIAQYWQANSIMLDTGGAVTIRDVWDYGSSGGIRPYPWEEDTSLLDPRHNYANFVIAAAHSGLTRPAIELRFGPPVRVVPVGTFTVLVYDRNLLPDLSGLPAPWPSPIGQ
jgi:hypothetical protein